MRKYIVYCLSLMLLVATSTLAQDSYSARARKYVDQYATLAILEQKKSGIPASITLGQGILETEAGISELMTAANNHFGIKCKNGYQGPSFSHTDDAPDECFKSYSCAAESFRDHSELLRKNPRYAPLFSIQPTDYAGWAKCLKKCGYATSPQYAQNLIRIIEDFKLQSYTLTAFDSSLTIDQLTDAISDKRPGADSVTSITMNSNQALSLSNPNYPHPAPVATEAASKKPVVAATTTTLIADKVAGHHDSVKQAPVAAIKTNVPALTHQPLHADTMYNTVARVNAVSAPVVKPVVRADSIKTVVKRPVVTNELPVVKAESETISSEKSSVEESRIVMVNGLKAFYAFKDEMLLAYAMKYKISYPQLLLINDLTDGPLPYNMYVYLERKLTRGTNSQHIVRDGESLFMAAQTEGMQLRVVRELNLLNPNEEPVPGTILELQSSAHTKPATIVGQMSAHNRNMIVLSDDKAPARNSDYIEIKKGKPTTFADTARPKIVVKDNLPAEPIQPTVKVLIAAQSVVKSDTAVARFQQKVVLTNAQTAPEVKSVRPVIATPAISKVDSIAVNRPVVNAAGKPASGSQSKFYTVKKGDTAFSIAKNNNLTLPQLLDMNNLEDGQIKIGQTLQVKE